MSIRLLAIDLYRTLKDVEELECQLQVAPIEKQEKLLEALRKKKAERDAIRRMLDGCKDAPTNYLTR